MHIRPVLYLIGLVLNVLAASMIFPLLADVQAGHEDWKVFLFCMVLTGFFGGALTIANKEKELNLHTKEVFIITVFGWIVITTFAALPFKFSQVDLSTVDAFFEAMSGLTTTGATVIENISSTPPGILMWRAMMQWLGGIAILIMALTILPYLRVGGMQVFQNSSTNKETNRPRLIEHSKGILYIYIALTIICGLSYGFGGMGFFDSIIHAMTTLSTGGFSSFDQSFLNVEGEWIKGTAIVFMLVGGLPFIMFLKTLRGTASSPFKDNQTLTYILVFLFATFILFAWLYANAINLDEPLIMTAAFTSISLMTGTGYATVDYAIWGGSATTLLLFLMTIGGCAGSTTCGIKIFRFQILYGVAKTQVQKLIHPSGVFIPRYQNKPIKNDAIISVMSFFFVFATAFVLGTLVLAITGLDLTTAISATVACLSNVGPGIGDIVGPSGNYASLPDAAKWTLSLCMILGRLELFMVLVVLSPHFWKS